MPASVSATKAACSSKRRFALFAKSVLTEAPGGDDLRIVDENIYFDGSSRFNVVEKFCVHPDVSLLRATGRTIMLKAPPKFFSFSNIMSSRPVAGKPEPVKTRSPRCNRKRQSAMYIGLHLAEKLPMEFDVHPYKFLCQISYTIRIIERLKDGHHSTNDISIIRYNPFTLFFIV